MPRNPYVCLVIVASLGGMGIGGLVGLVLIAIFGREGPALLPALMAVGQVAGQAGGALASFLVQVPRGSVGLPEGTTPAPAPVSPERKAA
jgi:hypothetical protein